MLTSSADVHERRHLVAAFRFSWFDNLSSRDLETFGGVENLHTFLL